MATESILLTTKQSYNETATVLLEAQEKNQELMCKVQESDSKIVLLEDSIKRFKSLCLQVLWDSNQHSTKCNTSLICT